MQSSKLSYLSIFKTRPSQLHLHLLQKEKRHIHDPLNCKSIDLIYFIECKKWGKQYIGENKRHLHHWSWRFGEHRRSILNYRHFPNPTPVSEHFNQADHSINDVLLIPLGLIRSNCDSVRKARDAHLHRKTNRFPFLDILGYLKNTYKNPKFGRVRQVPIRELGWEFPGWDLSHFAKFGIFMGIL